MKIPDLFQKHKFRLYGLLATVIFAGIAGCTGIRGYQKVPVTFRRAAIIQNLDKKTLLVGPLYQRSQGFQSATDVRQAIQQKCEKNHIFSSLEMDRVTMEWTEDLEDLESVLTILRDTDWSKEYPESSADLLITGAIKFITRDRSGNDIQMVTNRYGYTYPKRVYRERLSYSFEMGMMLIDLKTGEILLEKTVQDDGEAEGGADSVSLFFDMVGPALDKCIDHIQGPKIRTKRYLLYR